MLVNNSNPKKSEQTKDLIFQKTFEIVAEKGFAGVNHREVAQACGLSVGIVYKYLGPSKNQLGVLMDYIITQGYSVLSQIPENLTPLEKIKLNQKTNLEFFIHQPGYAILFLHFYIYSRFDEDLHKWNSKLTRLAESRLNDFMVQSKKTVAENLSRSLHSLLVGEIIKFVSLKQRNIDDIIEQHLKQVELMYNSAHQKS